jgi:hypothetical protein
VTDNVTLDPAPAAPTPPRGGHWGSRRVRIVGALTGVVVAVAGALLVPRLLHGSGGDPGAASAVPAAWGRPAVSAARLVDRSGVKITQVAVTGGGGLVDLRYQVVDPDRANALHEPSTPPAVVDERSGLVVHELLMSHSHTGPFKAGVTYYLVFNNPGNWVRHGSKVTVLLGNAQVEHVVVR